MSDEMMDGDLEDFRAACLDAITHIKTIPRATLRRLLVKALSMEREYTHMLVSRFPEMQEEGR